NDPGDVLRTEVGGLDRDRRLLLDAISDTSQLRVGDADRAVEQDGGFAGDPDMPETIGSIAGDFQIDCPIVRELGARLEIQTGHRQALHEFVEIHLDVEILSEPLPTDDHEFRTPSTRAA